MPKRKNRWKFESVGMVKRMQINDEIFLSASDFQIRILFSPPVLMLSGLLCIGIRLLLDQNSLDDNSYLDKSCS